MATTMETLLAELLEETTKQLLNKVRKGEATAADIKNIRELLKDNGITSDTGEEGNELDILSEELPFAAPLKLVSK